jgi:protein involved in polysaccharide export with SLBB domain
MNWFRKAVSSTVYWGPVLGLLCLGSGCLTTEPSAPLQHTAPAANAAKDDSPDFLRVGDAVSISFTGVPNPPAKFEGRIRDDGKIYLQYINEIQAAGKTATQLEDTIRTNYVPAYFRRLTVKVNTEGRFFVVEGEVKLANRYVYSGPTTVLSAVATAGGFTDFAKKTKVQVIRVDGHIDTINCQKAKRKPKLDLPVYPGDIILIPRRVF